MLLDDEEMRIMATAAQPQLRVSDPDNKARYIFDDFFTGQQLAGTKILELGPGQYGFARLAASAGATVVAIDHDPAVVALGRKRGYNSILADLLTFDWSSLRGEFDGLFARHSIAPPWFQAPAPLGEFVATLSSVLKPAGWGWVLPWNRYVSALPAHIDMMLGAQRRAFERQSFTAVDLRPLVAALGFDQSRDNDELFVRNLDPTPVMPDVRRIIG